MAPKWCPNGTNLALEDVQNGGKSFLVNDAGVVLYIGDDCRL